MIIYFLAFLALLYNFYYVFCWFKVDKLSTRFFLVALGFAVEAAIVHFLLPDPYLHLIKDT